ncbi:hypothetical protein [Prochlorococcus sp. MIT 1306]|uniref:hypothetical protein n=1 Tax=Prochlorococcus sp. MIT 1306 TaxID=1799667 RepID=UPI0007B3AD39|nr:hypothetical protein [Prochlorococcus sp. MIT 1306]KZR63150.1 hypothetical protein PMIT1306_01633 [Prochlorococcus sp. MIT 1306]
MTPAPLVVSGVVNTAPDSGRAVKGGYYSCHQLSVPLHGSVPASPEPLGWLPAGIGTVTSRFLCFPETALSRRRQAKQLLLPKGAAYSSSLVREMIEADASVGFDVPIPDGANFVEVSMPPAVMHVYKQARQDHPNAINLPPMRIVERNSADHTIALLQGGVIYIKEDPQQS